MTLNADPVVLVWISVATVGSAYAVDALRTARSDLRLTRAAARATRHGRLEEELVRGDLSSAYWIVAQELANLLVGVLALTNPGPPTLLAWVIPGALIFAAAALPIRLAMQRHRRRRFIAAA